MTAYKDIELSVYEDAFRKENFKMQPMHHQFATLAKSLNENLPRFGVFNGVGTGKTLNALYLAHVWRCKKIFVICPSSAFPAWEKNIKEGTDWSYVFLSGSRDTRIDLVNSKADVFIINYEGLKTIYGSRQSVIEEDDDGTQVVKNPWQIEMQSMIHGFDCLIIDEFHKCGGFCDFKKMNIQTRIIHTLASRARCLFGLTGTPFKNELLNTWALMMMLNNGRALGNNFYTFRRKYHFNYWGHNWKLKPSKEDALLDAISQHSISFSKHECIDLPPLTREILSVKKTAQQCK